MRVKVSDELSSPRPVNGGAPQGSCAGLQMYTVGIDDMAKLPLDGDEGDESGFSSSTSG